MISNTNHDSQWGRSEVVIIYPDLWWVNPMNPSRLFRGTRSSSRPLPASGAPPARCAARAAAPCRWAPWWWQRGHRGWWPHPWGKPWLGLGLEKLWENRWKIAIFPWEYVTRWYKMQFLWELIIVSNIEFNGYSTTVRVSKAIGAWS